MIFYDCKTAPSPRRTRMFVAEKGLEIETRQVDLGKGEQLSCDFLAINPQATVPVLVTDEGDALTENVAIAVYLEETHPEPALIGRSAIDKARVLMWNSIVESQGLMAIAEAFRNSNPHMKGRAITGQRNFDQIPELGERGQQRAMQFLEMLNARLANTPFIAGDRFTMADITAFVTVDFGRIIKLKIPESHVAVSDWFARVKSRASASL